MGGTGARAAAVEGMLFGVAQPMEEDEKKAMCEQKFAGLAKVAPAGTRPAHSCLGPPRRLWSAPASTRWSNLRPLIQAVTE